MGMSPAHEKLMNQRNEAQRIKTAQATCTYGTNEEVRQKLADNKRTDLFGIYAIKNGTVVRIQTMAPNKPKDDETQPAYGNNIIIRDSDGLYVRYAHLDEIYVKVGDNVSAGSQIGKMGDTGKGIPGPNLHLHISVYPSNTPDFTMANSIINPFYYILDGIYPCNTKISTWFHQKIGVNPPYQHEGLDFSGQIVNLIINWKKGLNGQETLNAQ